MKHPSDEKLRAWLDDELAVPAAASVDDHLVDCGICQAKAAVLRETANVFAVAMARMDAVEPDRWSAPAADIDAAFASPEPPKIRVLRTLPTDASRVGPGATRPGSTRSVRTGPVLVHGDDRGTSRRFAPSVLRWAAGIALLVAAGGTAAVMTGIIEPGRGVSPAATSTAVDAVAAETAVHGGAVFARPVDGAMEVVLTGAPAGSRVVVELTDGQDVIVEVTGASAPRFEPQDGRVIADLDGVAGVVRIAMPRGLRTARVVWEGRIVVQIAGDAVTPEGATGSGIELRVGG